ncbi:DUF5662 family protein [Clostridium sp. BJN0001]|uniref:DUF5662 family protein n=1 Tax=Clostridium sp. BJN0001 TaxID=2930219 RepID=UPI001FD0CDB9|nr:DUF5662 family protein [Clostridium sp. BJN0001]
MNLIGHFKTITNHKLLVMKYCFKAGLYKQGLLHDLSKYTYTEFSAGVKFYAGGVYSPNNKQKQIEGCSSAWLHHKGRNKHHFEYWIDYSTNIKDGLVGCEMPIKYTIEMFIDRMCASKNYLKDKYTDQSPLQYYEERKNYYLIHPKTRKLLEFLLNKLSNEGEQSVFKYIKTILHSK